jgi:hypothetical protein
VREHECGDGGRTGGEEERFAALELSERFLRCDAGGVRVPLVVEVAGIAVAIRPDRRAVEWLHREDSTFRFDGVRGLCVLSSIPVEKQER